MTSQVKRSTKTLRKRSLQDLIDSAFDNVKESGNYDSGIINKDGYVIQLKIERDST